MSIYIKAKAQEWTFQSSLPYLAKSKKAAEIDTPTILYLTSGRWLGKVHKEVCKLHVYRATVGKPAKKRER